MRARFSREWSSRSFLVSWRCPFLSFDDNKATSTAALRLSSMVVSVESKIFLHSECTYRAGQEKAQTHDQTQVRRDDSRMKEFELFAISPVFSFSPGRAI